VASTTEELNFMFYLILIHLNLYSRMWTVPTIMNSAAIYLTFEKEEIHNTGIKKKKANTHSPLVLAQKFNKQER